MDLKRFVNARVRPIMRRAGLDIVRYRDVPYDFDDLHARIWRAVRPYTMTSAERIYAAIEATRHVVRSGIPGAIVECGVWRGGSTMAMAMTLLDMGVTDRRLYLYDTFAGMSAPTKEDVRHDGMSSRARFERGVLDQNTNDWCRSPLDEVTRNLARTGYPMEMVRLVPGKVEDTIPDTLPGDIALLRLDTDFYASTRHELIHLYPQLHVGGVLIVDDYGYWQGARQAVDEYFAEHEDPPLLNRIDATGRLALRTR
jgi:hypothetical protein